MAHIVVPEAEKLLDEAIPVLGNGFVRLVDYLGGDQRIVQAARVSYGPGTKTIRQDRGLIFYLMSHDHTSPFEQVQLTFHAKMPIFVARQWVRHRTARLNEVSGRYTVMKDEFYLPEPAQMLRQSATNKQGRSEELVDVAASSEMISQMQEDQSLIYRHYEDMIEQGLAREVARANLPLSMFTEWYWQIDLHNLFHFLRLRLDSHAQYEIREYARALARCARAVAPIAYEAFEEHVLGSVRLSHSEARALAALLRGEPSGLEGRAAERFEQKLREMGESSSTHNPDPAPVVPREEPATHENST